MKYTRKYHTTPAENMSIDWLGPRIYRPNLEEVLRGALSPSAPQVHYITHFRYPSAGGFVNYLNKFLPLGNLQLNHELVSIDPLRPRVALLKRPRCPIRCTGFLRAASGTYPHD